jgi:hypothetical protein
MAYARRALGDSLKRGEAPFAPHLLYTQVLDDTKPRERECGMLAGHAWYGFADAIAVYVDLGITPGMQAGIEKAQRFSLPIKYRKLDGVADKPYDPTAIKPHDLLASLPALKQMIASVEAMAATPFGKDFFSQ